MRGPQPSGSGIFRIDLVQVGRRDDEHVAAGDIATGHLTRLEHLHDREQAGIGSQADAVAGPESPLLLPFVETAQQIDEPPRQALLDDFAEACAQAFPDAPQNKINRSLLDSSRR